MITYYFSHDVKIWNLWACANCRILTNCKRRCAQNHHNCHQKNNFTFHNSYLLFEPLYLCSHLYKSFCPQKSDIKKKILQFLNSHDKQMESMEYLLSKRSYTNKQKLWCLCLYKKSFFASLAKCNIYVSWSANPESSAPWTTTLPILFTQRCDIICHFARLRCK